MAEKRPTKINITNRKARHEYEIIDTYEAGIVLVGTEVKSVRAGKASINEAYCRPAGSEVWIHNMHIAPYEEGNRFNVEPLRDRKLLLHANEIDKIVRAINEKGLTLIPLKVYFSHGYAKVLIGIARGKKLYDKRETIKKRDEDMERRREAAGR